MITGVAVVPSTPLLLTRHLDPATPAGAVERLQTVREHATRVVEGLPTAEVTVVLAHGPALAAHTSDHVDLAGYGLPEIAGPVTCRPDVAAALGVEASQEPHPADVAVLTLLVGSRPVLPVAVPPDLDPAAMTALGERLATLDRRTALVVAGDLAAGHGVKPPRPGDEQASRTFDERVVALLDNGATDRIVRLADLARATSSRGWAALAVAGIALQRGRVGTVVRHHAAPFGVGYVVAAGG